MRKRPRREEEDAEEDETEVARGKFFAPRLSQFGDDPNRAREFFFV